MRTILLCFLLTFASCTTTHHEALDAGSFGLVGDGHTNNTVSLQRALDTAAHDHVELTLSAGTYLIGSLTLPSHTTLRLAAGATLLGSPDIADYPIETVRWEGRWRPGHRALLAAAHAQYISILGPGTIEGPPFALANLRNPRGPALIEPVDCSHLNFDGFSTNYRRMWSIHITDSTHVTCAHLHIRSEPKPSNGDGIDLDSCRLVNIHHCDIDTGDDAIALKSGRGTEGFTAHHPTQDVTISDCTLGSTFAGLAIGSEMSGGVRDVSITHCTFTRGVNAVYLKSRLGRGGTIQNLTAARLTAAGPKCFLRIDLLSRGLQDESPVPGPDGIPSAANLTFSDIHSTCDTFLEATPIPSEKPLNYLTITNVTGSTIRPLSITNARNVTLKNLNFTSAPTPLLHLTNVTD